MADRKFKSIIDELSDYVPHRDIDLFVSNRAQQLVASVNNFITLILENYSKDDAADLKNRLLLAIKNNDEEKFTRKIRLIKESKGR